MQNAHGAVPSHLVAGADRRLRCQRQAVWIKESVSAPTEACCHNRAELHNAWCSGAGGWVTRGWLQDLAGRKADRTCPVSRGSRWER